MVSEENIKDKLEIIEIPDDKENNLKDAKRSFRRKCHMLLPEKSMGNQNDHFRFEELNAEFIDLVKKVDDLILNFQKYEDEGCITEDYSNSRRSDEDGKDYTARCKESTCESDQKYATIIEYLENLEEGISEKCNNIKAYIDTLESGLNEKLEILTQALDENEKRYIADNKETQEKLSSMNEKIFETRQIIGASAAPKVKFSFLKILSLSALISDISKGEKKTNQIIYQDHRD